MANGFFGYQILVTTRASGPALTLWIVLLVGEFGVGLWLAQSNEEYALRSLGAGLILGAVLTGALFLLLAGVCAKINI